MVVRALCAAPFGLSAVSVAVEIHRGQGLPGVTLVGLARGAAREALVRVRAALGRLGVGLGALKLTVSLLPAELPKTGSALDLALAAALLGALGRVPGEALWRRRFYGEVSLDGAVLPAAATVLAAELACREGDVALHVAASAAPQARLLAGCPVAPTACLEDLLATLCGREEGRSPLARKGALLAAHGEGLALAGAAVAPPAARPASAPAGDGQTGSSPPCLSTICGQAEAKRAVIVAAAGRHPLLLVGPPGSGKSTLARALGGLLPPLTTQQQRVALCIRAAVGELEPIVALPTRPPFRAPHHTATRAALLGGGADAAPGELTLAHDGVLFLDELPEFARPVLEAMRAPLEDGVVALARAGRRAEYPTRCLLVAAMNPCPCGHWRPASIGSADGPMAGASASGTACFCAFAALTRYRARISGPLLDRLDVRVFVDPLRLATLPPAFAASAGPTSAEAAADVMAAQTRQRARQGDVANAALWGPALDDAVPLSGDVLARLTRAQVAGNLSMRGVTRLRRVARTIADLRAAAHVEGRDVQEALALRGNF